MSVVAPPSGSDRLRARYPRPYATTLGADDTLPPLAWCEEHAAGGLARVALEGETDLRDPRALEVIRFVRDCTSVNVPVSWSVAHAGDVDVRRLTHLFPPERLPGHDALLASWREFAFGVLYWRSGPGFISVRDVRPYVEASLYTIDTPAALRCFHAFAQPQPIRAVVDDPDNDEDFNGFVEAGIVQTIGDDALTLPYRVKKWPVPFNAI